VKPAYLASLEIGICYRSATNSFAWGLFSSFNGGVNLPGGVRLHARHDVAREIKCDPDSRVTAALAGDLRMLAGRQALGRVAVPEIVKTDLRQFGPADLAGPFMRQRYRLERAAIGLRDDD